MQSTHFSLTQKIVLLTGGLALIGLALSITFRQFATINTATTTFEWLFWLFCILLGSLLVFFIVQIVRPIQRVTTQMQAILQGKNYQKLKLTNNIKEVRVLEEFFNTMITSLEKVSTDIEDRNRLTEELNFAGDFQRQLLPKKSPQVPGLDIIVKTRPATEVGGDNFDIIPLKDSTLFYIGDATGHGLQAGLLMSMVNVLIHTFTSLHESPREILNKVNQFLTPKTTSSMFMTLVMLRWEHQAQKLHYTGCGHEHILIYRAATGKCKALKTGGIALGLIPDTSDKIHEAEIALAPNDVIVLFTDGITEAENKHGKMYGMENLRQSVERHASRNKAKSIFDSISRDFANFIDRDYIQKDDATLMVLKHSWKNASRNKKIQLTVDTAGITAIEKPNWDWEQ